MRALASATRDFGTAHLCRLFGGVGRESGPQLRLVANDIHAPFRVVDVRPLHSSYVRRMSRKNSPPRPPWRRKPGDLHPALPSPFLGGFLVWPLWIAAYSSGDASPSCLSRFIGFM
jgi:hypothetical protein